MKDLVVLGVVQRKNWRWKDLHTSQNKIRRGKWPWFLVLSLYIGFPGRSAGKESACNAGDSGLIQRSGRSPGEGIGYLLLFSWASLVAQLVKNLPAMQETCVWSLDWEDPLGKGRATHSSILTWRIPWTVELMGSQRVRHDWATFAFQRLPGNWRKTDVNNGCLLLHGPHFIGSNLVINYI